MRRSVATSAGALCVVASTPVRRARLLGVTTVVLETGKRLAPAIELYEGMGHAHPPLRRVPLLAGHERLLRKIVGGTDQSGRRRGQPQMISRLKAVRWLMAPVTAKWPSLGVRRQLLDAVALT